MATVEITTLPALNAEHTPHGIDLNLTGDQAVKLVRITKGLIAEGAQLSGSGSVIRDGKEALKYLIEQATTP